MYGVLVELVVLPGPLGELHLDPYRIDLKSGEPGDQAGRRGSPIAEDHDPAVLALDQVRG